MLSFARIKPGQIRLPSGPVLKAGEFSTVCDARAVLEHANADAARIVEEAKAAFEAERQRGFEEGSESARLEMSAQMIEIVGNVVDYIANVEQDMIDIVAQSLEKILGEMAPGDVVVKVVRTALTALRNEKTLTLRVAPDNVTTVRERLNEILAPYPLVVDVHVVADSRLSTTGCILESDIGVVDASIEGQIAVFRQSFEKLFGERKR
jgi:type III secretion protein L